MAIIPSRDNFQVGVQPFGARVSGAPAPADVTRNTRVLAQGLMAADRIADDKAKTDAMYALSRYQESLDRLRYDQNDGFSVRKGDAANHNTDGSSVWEEYQNRVIEARNAATDGLGYHAIQYFNQHAVNTTQTFNRALMAHQTSEDRAWKVSVNENRINQKVRNFTLNILDDPVSATQSLGDIRLNIAQLQKLNGWSAEEAQEKYNAYLSTGFSAAIADLAENDDLEKAETLFEHGKPHLSVSDIIRTRRILDTKKGEVLGLSVGNQVYDRFASEYPQDDLSALDWLVVDRESNDQDYDKNGNVLTSPKGAQGRWQVTDPTNRDPGFGVKPARDDSLEERARVGRDYLHAMLKRYDGNIPKALAAYNAGPGQLDKWVKQYGNDWLAHAYFETQKYVQDISGKFQAWRKDRGRHRVTDEELADAVRQAIPDNIRAQKIAIQQATQRNRQAEAARKQITEENDRTVYQTLIDSGGDLSAVSSEQWDQTDPEDRAKFYSFAEKIGKGVQADDPYVYNQLCDDGYLNGLNDSEFLSLRSRLTESSWQFFAKRRGHDLSGTGKGAGLLSRFENQLFENNLRQIGIDPKPKKDDTDANADIATKRKYIQRRLDLARELKGGKLTLKETEDEINKAFAQTFTYTQDFLGFLPMSDISKRAITLTYSDIPSESVTKIQADFQRRGMTPTKGEILEAYLVMRSMEE